MSTALLYRYVGLPAFALYTLALHIWSCFVGYAYGGELAALLSLLSPVISWLAWCAYLLRETGSAASGFILTVLWWWAFVGFGAVCLRRRR